MQQLLIALGKPHVTKHCLQAAASCNPVASTWFLQHANRELPPAANAATSVLPPTKLKPHHRPWQGRYNL
jgi:hypothetical protein